MGKYGTFPYSIVIRNLTNNEPGPEGIPQAPLGKKLIFFTLARIIRGLVAAVKESDRPVPPKCHPIQPEFHHVEAGMRRYQEQRA